MKTTQTTKKTQTNDVVFAIMSVGPYKTNWTTKRLNKMGGTDKDIFVILPKQFSENAPTYEGKATVYIYDEQKYINESFEYFGFIPRNCGGIGRQGVAEFTTTRDEIVFEIDDDMGAFSTRNSRTKKSRTLQDIEELKQMVRAFYDFYKTTGILIGAKTGASIPGDAPTVEITNSKIFNNFIMDKYNDNCFDGFKCLISDDYRFNVFNRLYKKIPTISVDAYSISFHQNQGDRDDGNAVIYNTDNSWKKSYALKMMFPYASKQYGSKETNRMLFREELTASRIYPPIILE